MELRMWLCCVADYRQDSLQTDGGDVRLASCHSCRNRSEQSSMSMPLQLVLQCWGGGSVVLSPSRLSSLAVSPSRLSPLALSPSRLSLFARSPSLFADRYSSGFSARDVVLSALLSEFRGCIETTW